MDQEGGADFCSGSGQSTAARRAPQLRFDKVATKFGDYSFEQFVRAASRVVPPAVARKGSFIGKNVVLMPSTEYRRLCWMKER